MKFSQIRRKYSELTFQIADVLDAILTCFESKLWTHGQKGSIFLVYYVYVREIPPKDKKKQKTFGAIRKVISKNIYY